MATIYRDIANESGLTSEEEELFIPLLIIIIVYILLRILLFFVYVLSKLVTFQILMSVVLRLVPK
jgi:hypothetical protein